MSHRTTFQDRNQSLLEEMTERMTTLVQHLSSWLTVQADQPPTLAALEQQVLRLGNELLSTLLARLLPLLLPHYDAPELPCSCGGTARYQRDRCARVHTLLGPIQFLRPYYLCTSCHHGTAPLDQQLQFCAGSISAGLEELLALLGAQADSFEAAVPILEKLTLLRVAPNTVREATERLGQVITASEQHERDAALAAVPACPLPADTPTRTAGPATYVSMDGMQVRFADGWHECKLGCVYTTTTRRTCAQPETSTLHAVGLSYVADVVPAEAFGPLLWSEAQRRGVSATSPVVVIGDGSAWIWNIAEMQFPGAVQIVDWYHASGYIWQAAHTLYGEATPKAEQWAKAHLTALWEGKVAEVIARLAGHLQVGEGVVAAHTYMTNNQQRMQYAAYREQGLQVGSGSIESGCKHVLGARLKQAGMVWSRDGAQAVAKVRARLKSGRWDESVAHRPPLQRGYVRHALVA